MCTIMRNFHYIRTGLIYHFCWFPDIAQNFLKQTRQKSGALEVRDLSEDFILGHRGNLLKVGSLFSEMIDPSMEPFRAKYVDGSRPL